MSGSIHDPDGPTIDIENLPVRTKAVEQESADERAETVEPGGSAPEGPRRRFRARRVAAAVTPYAFFLALAFWVTYQYWIPGRVSQADISDQAFFEYVLAHAAQSVTHLANPLVATGLNVPYGVNLMANTAVLALAIPLTPVTLLCGTHATFALILTLGLAGTAAAWYYVLRRHVVRSRSAAFLGALVAGFGPGLVSHVNGHPNIVAQFLLPFIALRVWKLFDEGKPLRNGPILAALVVAQAFINEEMLFLTAVTLLIMAIGYACFRPRRIRERIGPFAAGIGIATLIAGAALAYPLWYQFAGPDAYHGLNKTVASYSTDIAAFPAFASQTLFGFDSTNHHLSLSVAEENAFFGAPLLLAFAIAAVWLRRDLLARLAFIAGIVLGALSLGPRVIVDGHKTHIHGPFRYLAHLPLFDTVVATRFSLMMLPVVAITVALAHDRIVGHAALRPARAKAAEQALPGHRGRGAQHAGRSRSKARRAQAAAVMWCLLVGVALISIFPTPIATQPIAPTPAFFTSGEFRSYVPPGDTVLSVPLPGAGNEDDVAEMFWAAHTNLAFAMPRGYFLGPDTNGVAYFGALSTRTTKILSGVEKKDKVAVIKQADRRAMVEDLRNWHVAIIVQMPDSTSGKALRQTISDLVGSKPEFKGGVWVWDVRPLLSGTFTSDIE